MKKSNLKYLFFRKKRYEIRMNDHTEIPVYNYIYDTNNLTWGKYMQLSRKGFHEPLDKTLWYVK